MVIGNLNQLIIDGIFNAAGRPCNLKCKHIWVLQGHYLPGQKLLSATHNFWEILRSIDVIFWIKFFEDWQIGQFVLEASKDGCLTVNQRSNAVIGTVSR